MFVVAGMLGLVTASVRAQSVATVLDRGLFEPHSVAVLDTTEFYITDSANNRVLFYNPDTDDLVPLAGAASEAGGHVDGQGIFARFSNPQGIIAARGGLVVADSRNHVLRFVTFNGEVTTLAGAPPDTPDEEKYGFLDGPASSARFRFPTGLAVDAVGNIYIADTLNNAIRKLDTDNQVTTVAAEGFFQPSDVDLDDQGILYVADTRNQSIKTIDLNQSPPAVSLLAGSSGRVRGYQDSAFAETALFTNPRGIHWLGNSNGLLVSDTGNHVIRRVFFNPEVNSWSVETVTGQAGVTGQQDGPLDEATLNSPTGLDADNLGAIIVVDRANNALRRIQRTPTLPPVSNPSVGWVDIVITQFGDAVTVLRPVTQAIFNNDVTIAALSEDGTETFFTAGATPEGFNDTIPEPNRETGSTPPPYEDGMPPSQIPNSMVSPLPDLTVKLRSFAENRRPSSEVSARFIFKTGTPIIQGDNAASFTVSNITSGAVMYYTVDGSEPTNEEGNPNSIGPINSGERLSFKLGGSNLLFKVRAFRDQYAASQTALKEFSPTNFIPNEITFGFERGEASSDFVGAAGQRFYAPVTLSVLPNQLMYSLQFNLTVTNLFGAPPVLITEDNQAVDFGTSLVKPHPILEGVFVPIPPSMLAELREDVETFEFVTERRVITNETGGEVEVSNVVESISFTNIVPVFTNLTFVDPSENLLGVGWLERFGHTNLYNTAEQDLIRYSLPHDTLFNSDNGKVVVGDYNIQIPTTAQIGDQYEIRIGRPSATADGVNEDVFIDTPQDGALGAGKPNAVKNITVGQRRYVVGDAAPFRWLNAGDFGDTNLLSDDLIQVFQSAVYELNTPPTGSDFYDSMDSSDGLFRPDFDASAGGDTEIDSVRFGDGLLQVDDIWVTFRRALDPSRKWYVRYWQDGQRVAEEFPNQFRGETTQFAKFSESTGGKVYAAADRSPVTDRPVVTITAQDAAGTAGQLVTVPIRVQVPEGHTLRILVLNLNVVPLDGAPDITEPVDFLASPAMGEPGLTLNQNPGNFAAAWLDNSVPGLTGDAVLGTLQFQVPDTAGPQAAYRIEFEKWSGSPNGLAVFGNQITPGIVTLKNRSDSSWDDDIPDTWRLRYFGTTQNLLSHAQADADGDKVDNWHEFRAGTDPNDIHSFFKLMSSRLQENHDSDRGIQLRWPTRATQHYIIECASRLNATEWTEVAEVVGNGALMQYTDHSNQNGAKFYRVRLAE